MWLSPNLFDKHGYRLARLVQPPGNNPVLLALAWMNWDQIIQLLKCMAWGKVSWLCKTTCHDNEVRQKVESAQDLICIKGRKVSKPGILFFSDCFGKICMAIYQPTGFIESQDSCPWVYVSLEGKSNLLPLVRIGMNPVCSSQLTHWCWCDCLILHTNPLKLFSCCQLPLQEEFPYWSILRVWSKSSFSHTDPVPWSVSHFAYWIAG